MPITNIPIYNSRMLTLLKEGDSIGFETAGQWCNAIGFLGSNLGAVRTGERNFTIEQMIKAAKLHQVSMDWICGLTDIKAAKPSESDPVQMIAEALQILQSNTKSAVTQKKTTVVKKAAKV